MRKRSGSGMTYTVAPRVPAASHRVMNAELIRMVSVKTGFSAMLCK